MATVIFHSRSTYRDIAGFTALWSSAVRCLPVDRLCNRRCQPLNVYGKIADIIVFLSLVQWCWIAETSQLCYVKLAVVVTKNNQRTYNQSCETNDISTWLKPLLTDATDTNNIINRRKSLILTWSTNWHIKIPIDEFFLVICNDQSRNIWTFLHECLQWGRRQLLAWSIRHIEL